MRLILAILFLLSVCTPHIFAEETTIQPGDTRFNMYLPLIQGKRIALFSNHTGIIGKKHILDVLLARQQNIALLFSPEHGFRGDADAGEKVSSSIDKATGLPIYSLYGKSEKISPEIAEKYDVLLIDIQDVGLRFYTYYITMYNLMDFCAQHGKQIILLDRPNPNGFYVDGPILDMKYKSGVGRLPIPTVYGMTLGELARMINGEHWLPQGRISDLTVIPCLNYTHQSKYRLSAAPSPNLKIMKAIYLYPSLCYFEATPISIGRGTDYPFLIFGHPEMKGDFHFTPRSMPGAKNPPLQDKECRGYDLRQLPDSIIWKEGINLEYLITAYKQLNIGDQFFTPFFEKLVGVDYVRQMIEAGKSADEIKRRWQNDIEKFKIQRRPYLLYSE